jgi:23S rRNA pseudouridine1911/1915/1917 synthase
MSANYSAPAAGEPAASLVQVPAALRGMRVDQALAALMTTVSRSRIRTWIDAGKVAIDGVPVEARRRLDGGEWIRVEPLADPRAHAYAAEPIALTIVHEDDAIIVVDKPAGLVVHPGSGNWEGTLANALLHHAPELARVARAGIVHRLDKDTSGLLVVARTDAARTALVRQLQARSVHREYLALAIGDIAADGKIDAPIGRHPVRRTSMAVVASGKPAVTHFTVRERFGDCALLDCRLETGRTHQIRVHLASLGHPLVGDRTYARRSGVAFPRQALHAHRLGLVHPTSGAEVHWTSPLPEDFASLLAMLRQRRVSAP